MRFMNSNEITIYLHFRKSSNFFTSLQINVVSVGQGKNKCAVQLMETE